MSTLPGKSGKSDEPAQRLGGLRAVALIELGKGAVVLLAGAGLLSLVHGDVGPLAEELVLRAHLNPASGTPRVFVETAARLIDARLWLRSAGALAYALLRRRKSAEA